MHTVEFIKQNGLAALKEQLAIEVKKYPGFFVLNYNQLDSPTLSPVVQECRGLILSEDLEVVCRSFNRFFNYGETPQVTSKMQYEGALAYVKLDGSLLVVYYNQVTKCWHAATRNAAFAEGFEKSLKFTYAQLALNAFGVASFEEVAEAGNLDKDVCYIFELYGPYNKVIKAYSENKIALLSAIRKNGQELLQKDVDVVFEKLKETVNVSRPVCIKLRNESHLQELVEQCTGLDEGFVVYNEEIGLRVKAKSPGYLAAAHLKVKDGQHVPIRAATLVATGEHVEWLAYNPEDEGLFEPYILARDWLKDQLHEVWAQVCEISDQKELAMRVRQYPFSSVIFRAKKENKAAWEIFSSDSVKMQAKLLMQCVNKQ